MEILETFRIILLPYKYPPATYQTQCVVPLRVKAQWQEEEGDIFEQVSIRFHYLLLYLLSTSHPAPHHVKHVFAYFPDQEVYYLLFTCNQSSSCVSSSQPL